MKGIRSTISSCLFYATILLSVASTNTYSMEMDVSFLGNSPKTGIETKALGSGGQIVSTPAPQSRTYELRLKGAIELGDYDKLVKIIKNYSSFPHKVIITSPGGNVIEAIKMGRLFNKSLVHTFIQDQCNSSCFLLWVGGGASRLVVFNKPEDSFEVGLHRPKYDQTYFAGLSIEQAKVKYAEVQKLVADYLQEMDIPQSITEKMMATSSTDILWVNALLLSQQIGLTPHVFDEWENAKCGDKRLTNSEEFDYAFINSTPHSKGYTEYLEKKFNNYTACINKELTHVRVELIEEMFPDSAR